MTPDHCAEESTSLQAIVRWCLINRTVVVLFAIVLMGAEIASVFPNNQELLPTLWPGV